MEHRMRDAMSPVITHDAPADGLAIDELATQMSTVIEELDAECAAADRLHRRFKALLQRVLLIQHAHHDVIAENKKLKLELLDRDHKIEQLTARIHDISVGVSR
jgi:hypothetical protein